MLFWENGGFGAFFFLKVSFVFGVCNLPSSAFSLFFSCMLLLLNYAFSIFPQRLSIVSLFLKFWQWKTTWTRLDRQDQDWGLQQFVERYSCFCIDRRSGAVLVGNTEAMGELRLPPSGGDAALQHYLNFVQVFNQRKKWHFYVILSMFVFVWVQSYKGLQQ